MANIDPIIKTDPSHNLTDRATLSELGKIDSMDNNVNRITRIVNSAKQHASQGATVQHSYLSNPVGKPVSESGSNVRSTIKEDGQSESSKQTDKKASVKAGFEQQVLKNKQGDEKNLKKKHVDDQKSASKPSNVADPEFEKESKTWNDIAIKNNDKKRQIEKKDQEARQAKLREAEDLPEVPDGLGLNLNLAKAKLPLLQLEMIRLKEREAELTKMIQASFLSSSTVQALTSTGLPDAIQQSLPSATDRHKDEIHEVKEPKSTVVETIPSVNQNQRLLKNEKDFEAIQSNEKDFEAIQSDMGLMYKQPLASEVAIVEQNNFKMENNQQMQHLEGVSVVAVDETQPIQSRPNGQSTVLVLNSNDGETPANALDQRPLPTFSDRSQQPAQARRVIKPDVPRVGNEPKKQPPRSMEQLRQVIPTEQSQRPVERLVQERELRPEQERSQQALQANQMIDERANIRLKIEEKKAQIAEVSRQSNN